MIQPEDFYTEGDHPSEFQRNNMWRGIRRSLLPGSKFFLLQDKRSFLYGMAASFILIFSSIGVYSVITSAIERSQPHVIKVDHAYQAAIQEFEKVAGPGSRTDKAGEPREGFMLSRKEQLQLLENAIHELRLETNSHDLTELKRSKLRHLYGLKLKLLQEMVEQGEIEL